MIQPAMLLTTEFAETCADNHIMRQNVLTFLIEALGLLPKDYACCLKARDASMHPFLLHKNRLIGYFLNVEELWAELELVPGLLEGKPDPVAIRQSEERITQACADIRQQLREML